MASADGAALLEFPNGETSYRVKEFGEGEKLIGRTIEKNFSGELYYAQIIDYDPVDCYYKALYTDGDEEELEWKDLKGLLEPLGTPSKIPVQEAEAAAARSKKERLLRHEWTSPKTDDGKRKRTETTEDQPAAKKRSRSTATKVKPTKQDRSNPTKSPQSGRKGAKTPTTKTPESGKKEPKSPAAARGRGKESATTPKQAKKMSEEDKDDAELARVEKELKANTSKKEKLQAELEAVTAALGKLEGEKAELVKKRDNREANWLARVAELNRRKAAHQQKKTEVLKEIHELTDLLPPGGRSTAVDGDQVDRDNLWDSKIGPSVERRVKGLKEEWFSKQKLLEDTIESFRESERKAAALNKKLGLTPTPQELAAKDADLARFEVAKANVNGVKAACEQKTQELQAKEVHVKSLWLAFRTESKALLQEEKDVDESKPKKLRHMKTPTNVEVPAGHPSGTTAPGSSAGPSGLDLNESNILGGQSLEEVFDTALEQLPEDTQVAVTVVAVTK